MIKSMVIAISLATLSLSNAFAQSGTAAGPDQTPIDTQQTSQIAPPHKVTRAEVRHELEELEAAGYSPAQGDDSSYPADILAAEEKVAAKHRAEKEAMASAGQSGQTKPMLMPMP